MPEPGGPGGRMASPQYLADQLTLFQPGRANNPHLLLLAPQSFSSSGITESYVVVATLCRANDAAANIAVGRNNKLPRPLLRVKGQLEEQLRTYLMTKIIWPFQKRVYLLPYESI